MKSIGGEFEIVPALLKNNNKFFKNSFFSSGRGAFAAILKFIRQNYGINKILLPDYLCSSIIRTVEVLNFKFDFYRINKELLLDKNSFLKRFDRIRNDDCAILCINYFGLLDLEDTIIWLRTINGNYIIIEDDVQALFEMDKKSQADFCFTSFRKTLPVPDGAIVKMRYNNELYPSINEEHVFALYKLIGGLIKYQKRYKEIDDEIYLNFFSKGEKLLDSYISDYKMSFFSKIILGNIDFEEIKKRRLENFNYLKKRLKQLNIKILIDKKNNKIPLCLPILIKNRDLIRNKLFENKIFLPVHWPVYKKYARQLEAGNFFSQYELSLVIDQRYTTNDMEKIASHLESLNIQNID